MVLLSAVYTNQIDQHQIPVYTPNMALIVMVVNDHKKTVGEASSTDSRRLFPCEANVPIYVLSLVRFELYLVSLLDGIAGQSPQKDGYIHLMIYT